MLNIGTNTHPLPHQDALYILLHRNQVLVEALVNISKHFDMVTIAEFVETTDEAEMAAKIGVDCLQGYLIGEPTAEPMLPYRSQPLKRKVVG